MITLKNIFLTINDKKIFKDLSLEFSKEGISVILGPNGSGKTLLTKVILGLVNIEEGVIEIDSKKIIKLGYSPQKITFLRRNVFDNIAFGLKIGSISSTFGRLITVPNNFFSSNSSQPGLVLSLISSFNIFK